MHSASIACLVLLHAAAAPQPVAPFQEIMRNRDQLFRGRVLASPEPRRLPYLSLDFEESDPWRLTHTDQNIDDLRVEKGVLRFRMNAESVVLGWGNYSAKAQKGAPVIGWKEGAQMEIRVRQDQPSGKAWDAQFRHRGSHDTGTLRYPMHWRGRHGHFQIPVTAQNGKAGEWVTVRRFVLRVVSADGLALTVTGKKGSVVEIDSVRVVKEDYRVWARKTFELPEAVHSAIATTSVCQDLWVNGQKAYTKRRTMYGSWYYFTTVDLKPYLKPGRNVIAIYDPLDMPKTLSTWMQVTVSTVTGKVFPIQTDHTWKTSGREEDGWQKGDFDDSHWKPTGDGDPSGYMKPGEPRTPVLLYDKYRLPAYSGRILLSNPDGPRLFYTEAEPVRFELALPPKMTPPEVHYRIYNEETAEQTVAGTARLVGKTDEALAYAVEPGSVKGGLYSLSMEAEGDPPLARCEPFIVTRKIPMKEVEGSSWDEGCKLTLVDEVDCTDAADPHPFEDPGAVDPKFATRVVERHGLRYRATVAEKDWRNLHSWFSWRVQFKNVNRPHWVVVDYPDDDARCLECEIRPYYENPNKAERDTTSWASAGAVTGGRYPVTYTMRQLRILVWPQARDAMVSLMKTFFSLGNVAAARIRVYEIDELPALKTTPRGRNLGLLTERAFVIAQSYGPSDFYNRGKNKPFPGELPAQYQDNPYLCWLKAAENYARYCRFTGQNTHFMGSFQYSRLNQGVTLDSGAEGCSLVPELREVLVNVLQANGISTYGVIEYATNFNYWERGWPSLSQAHRGADFMFQIDNEGHTRTGYMQSENPMTSRQARAAFLSDVADVAERFAAYPGFKGLALVVAPGWTGPAYPSDKTSFDDRTIAVFEQETGLEVPVTDRSVERFQQRHAWIMEHARDAWLDFRSRKMAEVHRAMVRRLRSIRRDLEYFVFFEPYDRPGDPQGLGRQYDRAGKADIRGLLRNHGYDPLSFAKERSVSLGRMLWSFDQPANRYRTCAARWEWARDPEAVKLFNRASEPRRAAFIRTGFSEGLILSRRQAKKPLWPLAHRIGYLLPRDPFCTQRFAEVMVDSDVEVLPYGFSDCHAAAGSEDRLREFVGEFVSLPCGRFQPIAGKGIDPNVHLAEAEIDGTYYLYVVNPAWWPCRVTLEVQAEAEVTRTRTGARVPVMDKSIQLDLRPYELIGLTGPRASLAPLAAPVIVPTDALARIEAMLSQLETRIRKSHPLVKVARTACQDGNYVECYNRMTRWVVFRSAFRDWQWPKMGREEPGGDRG